jgi:neutral ceramidase
MITIIRAPVRALVLAFFCLVGLAAAAGESPAIELRAGIARADITPDPQMLNWTIVPARPYGEVHDPLYVRALVLSDSRTRVAFIGWDLLDAREFAVARIRGAVSKATGIPERQIIIQASHNHSGPKSEMGPEPNTAREQRTSRPVQDGPAYRTWADRLVETCVDAVRRADAAVQPVDIFIGRAFVGEWLFNRRPIKPDQTVQSTLLPPNPYALAGGLRFGTVDPTLTVLSLRDRSGRNTAMLFHVPMHAVAVYSQYKGLSADWPGRVADLIRAKAGGEAMFLQGCAGDIVPARRGFEAVEAMAALISDRALAADKVAVKLPAAELHVSRAMIGLPATEAAAKDLGRESIDAEVMALTVGSLAFVTLPGEPLQEIGTAIQQRSPYPHTLVLGYANGRGIGYVGLPGGKVKGGYEMSEVGAGTDEAGGFLVETALRLLHAPVTAPDIRRSK